MNFVVGEKYSSKEIAKNVGGSVQPCMPTVDGMVVCCRARQDCNPRFPKELWVAAGPQRKRAAESWAVNGNSIPIFLKVKTGIYQYLGMFKVALLSRDPSRIAIANKEPMPEGPVQLILDLERAG